MDVLEIEREGLWEEAALGHFGRPWRFWAVSAFLAAFAPLCLILLLGGMFCEMIYKLWQT